MGEPTPGAGPTWQVTSVTPETIIDAANRPARVQVVTFRLADGTPGTVNIPESNFTAQTVREAVTAAAENLQAVLNLRG